MHRYFIYLAYNGTNFNGWQIQPNAASVQAELQKVFSTLLQQEIKIIGAGRTDTGVHANFFIAHFDCESEINNPEQLIFRANCFLHTDIVVYQIFKVDNNIHSRFDALSRTYKYIAYSGKNPFLKNFAYKLTFVPDIEKMNRGASYLFNYHDFTSFSKLHTEVKTNNCKIMKAGWEKFGSVYVFTIQADRFLRNMVRAIVGTLLEIGKEKKLPEEICKIIEAKNRSAAGGSVPAQGLFLYKIEYPQSIENKINTTDDKIIFPII